MPITIYNPYSHSEPSAIRKHFNSLIGASSSHAATYDEREGVVHTVIESGATGAALGAIHAHSPTGLDIKKVPADGVLGLLAVLASAGRSGKVARSAHAIGDRALAIFSFRSTAKLLAAKSGAHGEFGADPLTEAAKDL